MSNHESWCDHPSDPCDCGADDPYCSDGEADSGVGDRDNDTYEGVYLKKKKKKKKTKREKR
jgi:hypothetical protein